MKQLQRALLCGSLLLLFSTLLQSTVSGQQFLGRFLSELTLKPAAPYLVNAEFRVLSKISVAEAAFAIDSKFDLGTLRWQRFIASVTVPPLSARNRLTFVNGFAFGKNELVAALHFGGVSLGVEVILHNQTATFDVECPPAPLTPSLEAGLVVEAGVRTQFFTVASYTGFGVIRLVEDLDQEQLPIINEPFAFEPRIVMLDIFSEREPDRLVVAPFQFTEQVVAFEFYLMNVVSLSSLSVFTPTGWKKQIPGLSVKLDAPAADLKLRFSVSSTFELPGFFLTFLPVELHLRWGFFQWRSFTLFSDPPGATPFSFRKQVFQSLFELNFFRSFFELCAGPDCPCPGGVITDFRWRFGIELRFLFGS
jgi:hypothetical protein